jgi:hypothetical protein
MTGRKTKELLFRSSAALETGAGACHAIVAAAPPAPESL